VDIEAKSIKNQRSSDNLESRVVGTYARPADVILLKVN
jgi:hypothetical protein